MHGIGTEGEQVQALGASSFRLLGVWDYGPWRPKPKALDFLEPRGRRQVEIPMEIHVACYSKAELVAVHGVMQGPK